MKYEINLPKRLVNILLLIKQRYCKHEFLVSKVRFRSLNNLDQGQQYEIQCYKCKLSYWAKEGIVDE